MHEAEQIARPVSGELGGYFQRRNDFGDSFGIRWGKIEFEISHGVSANLKVILRVYRQEVCETYIVDTDAFDVEWNRHRRRTRDFYVLPYSPRLGPISCVKFSFVVHLGERSIVSGGEYIFMDRHQAHDGAHQFREITGQYATANPYRTFELDAGELQRHVDWYNHHFESLHLTPKFTKGQHQHPYHPKRYIHDQLDKVIHLRRGNPGRLWSVKVSVDCIDDNDFVNHLIHAHCQGVCVQCVVDWRKMTLTGNETYARLKRSGIELVGVFCTPKHHLIELEPDMHTKFIIFGDEDAIVGSFNITFDRWWANWESGMTFHSWGVCRLLDNIFQSQRGGVIRPYGIDPFSPFNLLYTFGRHMTAEGRFYRPHHAILGEINRARRSVKLCLFLIGELVGDHNDSVVDALINARNRGVDVQILFNGHVAHSGRIGVERLMPAELNRPLLPAVQRLKSAGLRVGLVYGQIEHKVPYSPIHSKYCVIDDYIVLEGSFNWYNTSVFSHDLLLVAANHDVARPYLHEFDQIQRLFKIYW
jgi:hypothetical protein